MIKRGHCDTVQDPSYIHRKVLQYRIIPEMTTRGTMHGPMHTAVLGDSNVFMHHR